MNTASKFAQIAQANHKPVVNNSYEDFQKKVRWGSHQYVRFVIKEIEQRALKGFGSVDITIDKTTDLFNVDEGRNSCYSSGFVCDLLTQKGFSFNNGYYEDHFDAFSTTLIWSKDLPKSPDKIGMCWK